MEKNLLKLMAIAHVVGGLMLCLLYFFSPLHDFFLQSIYATQPAAMGNESQLVFWLCILGPTISSWGVLFLALVQQFFITPTRYLWNCMLSAILIWSPLDSLLSYLNGIYVGVAGNVVVTVVFLILLQRIRPSCIQEMRAK